MEKEQNSDEKNLVKPRNYAYHLDVTGKSRIPSAEAPSQRYIEHMTQWERNPEKFIVADYPLHLNIELSSKCNMWCRGCPRHTRARAAGDMDFGLYKKIIDEGIINGEQRLQAVAPEWLGEPFLYPQIIDAIRYAKDKGVLDARINTNGTLIEESMAKRIISESGLDRIIFSLDAINEETYKSFKPGAKRKNYFKAVNENIDKFIELKEKIGTKKPIVYVQMIYREETRDELVNFLLYWHNKSDFVRIALYQSSDGNPDDRNRALQAPETIFPCPQLWQRMAIAWDGIVSPCVGDNGTREPLGNVKEKSVYDMWHGERINELREMHKNGRVENLEMCNHCDLNKIPKEIINYNNKIKNNGVKI